MKKSIKKIFFNIGIFISVFYYILSASTITGINNIGNLVNMICSIFCLISLMFTAKIDLKIFFFYFVVFALFSITGFFSGQSSLFYMGVIFLCSYKIDFVSSKKAIFIALIFGVIFVVLGYAFGFIEQSARYRDDGSIRFSFGFNHPNVLGQFYFLISLLLIDCYYYKLKWYNLFFHSIILICIYAFTDSRTSLICTLLVLISYVFLRFFKPKKIFFLFDFLPLMFVALIIFLGMNYGDIGLAKTLDMMTSGRLASVAFFFDKYPLTAFGQEVFLRGSFDTLNNGGAGAVLDSSYARLIVMFGIIPTVLYILSYIYTLRNYRKHLMFNKYIILLIYSIYILFEAAIGNFATNVFILYFSEVIAYISIKRASLNKKTMKLGVNYA